jgi:hypothetical protein
VRASPRGPSSTILLRPLHNLFVGRPNARRWKQAVNGKCQRPRELDQLIELARELDALVLPPSTEELAAP